MNKFGFFAVTLLVCLLFVNSAAAMRTSEALSARLAVRKQKLRVEDVEAGSGDKKTTTTTTTKEKETESMDDVQKKIRSAIDQVNYAKDNLRSVLKLAKEKAQEAAIQKVEDQIDAEIEKMKKEEEDKAKVERAARAAQAVLSDPATVDEISNAIDKRVQSEIARQIHEETVARQVSRELADQLIRSAQAAHNETISAEARAAKNVAAALKDADLEVKRAENAASLAQQQLKQGVEQAINNAENKYEKLMGTRATTGTTVAAKPAPKAPAKAGLIQMANIKKLKQQFRKQSEQSEQSE